jgi:sugar phosphate isomerase/epimerase
MYNLSIHPPLAKIEKPRKFRIGVTSYVYPADVLTNVSSIAPFVYDVELAFYESQKSDSLPEVSVMQQINELAQVHKLTFTVHLPVDISPASSERKERRNAIKAIKHIFGLTKESPVAAYILHLTGIENNTDIDTISKWQGNASETLKELTDSLYDPGMLCLENLFYNFSWCDTIIDNFQLGICIDTGHLLISGVDVTAHFKKYLRYSRVIHFHGVAGGKDHLSLTMLPSDIFNSVMGEMEHFHGVLTVEVFNYDDALSSLKRIETWLIKNPQSTKLS